MVWTPLTTPELLDELLSSDRKETVLIFKHSTRCSISNVALERINQSKLSDRVPSYLLDLLSYRSLSNAIAERLQVHHESPQVLLIRNGECFFDESHLAIDATTLEQALNSAP